MKLKLTSTIGVILFSILAGLVGVAGPASASTLDGPYHLCAFPYQPMCIYASGNQGAEMAAPSTPGLTNWTYPALGNNAPIKQANHNTCLQLDWASAGLDINYNTYPLVIGVPCVNDQAEMWTNVYDPSWGRTVFTSRWTALNGHGTYCLFAGSDNVLLAAPCDGGATQYGNELWTN